MNRLPSKHLIFLLVCVAVAFNPLNSRTSATALAGQQKLAETPEFLFSPEMPLEPEANNESPPDGSNWLSRNKWWVAAGVAAAAGIVAGVLALSPQDSDESKRPNGRYTTTW